MHGAGRRRDGILAGLQKQVNIDELIGPKIVVGIVEDCLQLDRARRCVDLVVDGQQFAGGQLGLVVAAIGVHLQCTLAHVLADLLQLVFGKREYHGDRMKLGNHQHRGTAGRGDVIARIDLAQSHTAVNRRLDVAVGQVQLGILNGGFVGGDGAFVGPERRL